VQKWCPLQIVFLLLAQAGNAHKDAALYVLESVEGHVIFLRVFLRCIWGVGYSLFLLFTLSVCFSLPRPLNTLEQTINNQ